MSIESFEVSKDETFGDLLKDYKEERRVNVGV